MKKVLSIFAAMIVLSTFSFTYADSLGLTGESAILVDTKSMQVLYEKNPHQKLYPASTTKILTGILAIEKGNLKDIVIVDQESVDLTYGSHIALEPGEEITLEDLLYALLIESANDAAFVIANHISGSIDEFCKLMNEKARQIGALNTNFSNPNGLPDEKHMTTAYDLALIARYAMENDIFKDIVKDYTHTIPITNKKTEERYLKSANRLLYSSEKIYVDGDLIPIKYKGVNGVKSGFTNAAQQCLVSSYEQDGVNLISVVLKSEGKNIYSDTHSLLNYGIKNFNKLQIGFQNRFIDNFEVENGLQNFVAGVTNSDLYYIMEKNSKDIVKEKITMTSPLLSPIYKGQVIGKVEYLLEGQVIGETDIVSTMDVEVLPTPSLYKRIMDKWYWFVFILLILSRILHLNAKKKRRMKRRSTLYGA